MLNVSLPLPASISLTSLSLLIAGGQAVRPAQTNGSTGAGASALAVRPGLPTVGPSEASGVAPLPNHHHHHYKHHRHAAGALRDMHISADLGRLLDIAPGGSDESVFSAIARVMRSTGREAPAIASGVPAVARAVEPQPVRITNRRQALAALATFEAQHETRLPQTDGSRADLVRLSMGQVQFRHLDDLLSTFPHALSVGDGAHAEGGEAMPAGAAAGVVYPPGIGPYAAPREARIDDQPVVVALDTAMPRRIRYSYDLREWHQANRYTDPVVEAAKLAMWERIGLAALLRSLDR